MSWLSLTTLLKLGYQQDIRYSGIYFSCFEGAILIFCLVFNSVFKVTQWTMQITTLAYVWWQKVWVLTLLVYCIPLNNGLLIWILYTGSAIDVQGSLAETSHNTGSKPEIFSVENQILILSILSSPHIMLQLQHLSNCNSCLFWSHDPSWSNITTRLLWSHPIC